ncbi:MAG: DJ-1/PfpI family protein [Campylobacterales bacterium]|nr:DJ-1/PfpI family protein [Campylobacterales bacterium]
MRIAFVAFDRMNMLDFFGAYDALMRLKTLGFVETLTCNTCALKEEVRDIHGLSLKADTVQSSLDGYDIVVVPGGVGSRTLMHDEIFLAWIKSARFAPLKAGVCTGALLLGAAGFLKEKRATTHSNALELLAPYCAEVVRDERVVDAGEIVTSQGVSASIDLGLHLCERLCGAGAQVAKGMDYPFFGAGL